MMNVPMLCCQLIGISGATAPVLILVGAQRLSYVLSIHSGMFGVVTSCKMIILWQAGRLVV